MSGPGLRDPTPQLMGIDPKRALLLQGPMSPFFRRFREQLVQLGVNVTKVNFNAGDDIFDHGDHVVHYRDTFANWPEFFERLVREHDIDTVFLFGDGRPYHRAIVEHARRLKLQLFVFEEGYLRPFFITLEAWGVNGHSEMPRDPSAYLLTPADATPYGADSPPVPAPLPTFRYAAWYSTRYSLALTFLNWRYPHCVHHRPLDAAREAFAWIRSGLRKLYYRYTETSLLDSITEQRAGRYFFVPLQVYCDYQLRHSNFETIDDFITLVVQEFARHAPAECSLVFKHHPLDRAYTDYGRTIRELASRHGLTDRIFYVHDLDLPSLLKSARACITINSTVGLQAIHHQVPTKTLGDAIYNLPGLTSQNPLAEFLRSPGEVDMRLYRGFRGWLLRHSQAKGSFYRRLPSVDSPTGVLWPRRLNQPDTPPASPGSGESGTADT